MIMTRLFSKVGPEFWVKLSSDFSELTNWHQLIRKPTLWLVGPGTLSLEYGQRSVLRLLNEKDNFVICMKDGKCPEVWSGPETVKRNFYFIVE